MKRLISIIIVLFTLVSMTKVRADEPDSAYLFAYTPDPKEGRHGLCFAWSTDRENWHPIGPEFAFVRSDYSRWGSEKRMFNPVLFYGPDHQWHAIWTLNETVGAFAYAKSPDLVRWFPQSYPIMNPDNNCLFLELGYNSSSGRYFISWVSNKNGKEELYATRTSDFKNFTAPEIVPEPARVNQRGMVEINGKEEVGTTHEVPWSTIQGLLQKVQLTNYRNQLHNEMMKDDPNRFPNLKPVEAAIRIDADKNKPISDKLLGIFFEDINYAADGGIYAELVQNRGFEYKPTDRGNDKDWNSKKAWTMTGGNGSFEIDTVSPIHPNNPHYAVLKIETVGTALQNEGFGGIVLKAKEKYDFSVFARTLTGKNGKLKIRLTDENGTVFGETTTNTLSNNWKKYTAVITVSGNVSKALLEIIPQTEGSVALDMVSLFPQNTFKGRKNGLRTDLAQTLADMKPQFVRFPGGCVAHGDGIENIYHWKNTIGPLEARKPQRNLWGYHQSMGLGYFEYFLFCEDIDAEPVPIVAAGVPCQNSAKHNHPIGGQQGGIPMCQMGDYIQDIFDLIEWANGDPKTNRWAKMRADAGHPKPFNLKYIGVGNEDLISDVFEERFAMIFNALKEKYPEITVIGTTGPWSEGSDYERGWEVATELNVPIVDEHYYQAPGWFIHNQDYYDRYDRNKSKVYLGEYAAHLPGRPNNIETALLEALHLINIERNGDVVYMTSYAPLLAKEGYTQWNPDLIYFNNAEVKPTVGYYVQKLFGTHAGDEYFASRVLLPDSKEAVMKRVACSTVRDTKTGDIILKMVNLLPVEVHSSIDMSGFTLSTRTATKTLLTGAPDDKNAIPQTSSIEVEDQFNCNLPPYSFTVIRMNGSK